MCIWICIRIRVRVRIRIRIRIRILIRIRIRTRTRICICIILWMRAKMSNPLCNKGQIISVLKQPVMAARTMATRGGPFVHANRQLWLRVPGRCGPSGGG